MGDFMGVSQAMYTGVTGLSVNSDSMAVIANNIANSNAKGFKYDRAEFEDLLSVDLSSGNAQMGRGSRLSNVRTMHTQGGLQVTDALTDLAIQGNGFFAVGNNSTEVQEAGGIFFTRVGSFNFDKDGYLSDAVGGHVKGYMADINGNLSSKLSDVRIVTNNLAPVATSKIVMNLNLDARAKPMVDTPFDLNNAEATSNFNTTLNIFDSQGRGHNMTVYFNRVADSDGITWSYSATVDAAEVTDAESGVRLKEIGKGIVRFSPEGLLKSEEPEFFEANFTDGAFANQKIELDFGKNTDVEEGNGVGASSSVAARSDTIFHSQNGYESGNLKSLRIELDGSVRGFYTNGVQRVLGAVAVATFENQDGLKKAGRNQFYKTVDSGPAKIGLPQTGTRGSLYASTLEESNVDLASQFVNMIMTQRGFQANSRSITTTDSMIEEVVNLKR
jgi:flagellar hook protein FlgE